MKIEWGRQPKSISWRIGKISFAVVLHKKDYVSSKYIKIGWQKEYMGKTTIRQAGILSHVRDILLYVVSTKKNHVDVA